MLWIAKTDSGPLPLFITTISLLPLDKHFIDEQGIPKMVENEEDLLYKCETTKKKYDEIEDELVEARNVIET